MTRFDSVMACKSSGVFTYMDKMLESIPSKVKIDTEPNRDSTTKSLVEKI